MKISDIKPGKKYWKPQTTGGGRNGTKTYMIEVFVLDVKVKDNRVLASLNRGAAKWFNGHSFSYWMENRVVNE